MAWVGLRKRVAVVPEEILLWTGRHMSLTFKLALPVLLSTVILVAVLGTMVSNQVQAQIDKAYDAQAVSTATSIEATYTQYPYQAAELNGYLSRLVETEPGIIAVRIVSLDQRTTVIASSRPGEVGTGGLLTRQQMLAVRSGKTYDDAEGVGVDAVVAPLRDQQGSLLGAVLITLSPSAEDAASNAVVETIVTAGLIAVAVDSLMILSAIYLGIIRRTRRVQQAVAAVAGGDTSVRLPETDAPRGRDEIFNLARSVGRMIAAMDEKRRGEALIRRLTQRALAGIDPNSLLAESLAASRDSLGLESCIYATINEDGSMGGWVDGSGASHPPTSLPIWVFALTRVAVEARQAILTDRYGQVSTFAEGLSVRHDTQAVVVPLPRTSKAGRAIVAIAPAGETIPDGSLAVLDAVAATISECLHMQAAEVARAESAVKSKVMAAVSHEMRNPLNSVLGFTALVLEPDNDNLTEKQRRQLGFVQSSANTMLTLVNNYLDLEKLRSG
ncbi:MAG TPA: histidine kinase dimerization/phospho-acceptor domain-containing protein, partial [Candidatus Dormibacteraeota bacterium]